MIQATKEKVLQFFYIVTWVSSFGTSLLLGGFTTLPYLVLPLPLFVTAVFMPLFLLCTVGRYRVFHE